MTNKTHTKKEGGYESLLVYWLAVTIYDLTTLFCERYMSLGVNKSYRTYDQMIQAARSGKQNIVEGSLEPSMESNLKLTGVARASYGELLEDYKDYLRVRGLPAWEKDDPRIMEIRRVKDTSYKTDESYESYKAYSSYLTNSESFGNLMVTLCYKEGYLLDQLLRSQEAKFVREGGFRERLFQKRIEYRKSTGR